MRRHTRAQCLNINLVFLIPREAATINEVVDDKIHDLLQAGGGHVQDNCTYTQVTILEDQENRSIVEKERHRSVNEETITSPLFNVWFGKLNSLEPLLRR
jgi:hypothetical protein